MVLALGTASKRETGQFEDGITLLVCFLKEHDCCFVGSGNMFEDTELGSGESFNVELADCEPLTFDFRRPRPPVLKRTHAVLVVGLGMVGDLSETG